MNRQALADRLIVYSDTVVAFSLVNGFAFLITLSDPDIRCSIAEVAGILFFVNGALPIAATWALFWLRSYERRLRADDTQASDLPDDAEAANDPEDPLVAGFWQRLFRVRIVLIWASAVVVIVGVYGATWDGGCVGVPG